MIRLLKIVLSLCIALIGIVFATQNIINIDQAFGAVGYVIGQVDQEVYPGSLAPVISNPTLVWLALLLIISLEYAAGLAALKGTWEMFRARDKDALTFSDAKKWTIIGAGLAMVVWFGLFHTIGGAVFQQWQTPAGDQSLAGAFWYGTIPVLIILYICQTPDE